MKYILAKTVGKVEVGNDGYPTGSLRPEKVPSMVEATYLGYSLDQSQVIIKCADDTVDVKLFGDDATELTSMEAKALFEQWQNEHDINCKCYGKDHTSGTHSQLNKPCLTNALCGVSHMVIDEAMSKDETDYTAWKADFDAGKKEDDVQPIIADRAFIKKRANVLDKIASGAIKALEGVSLDDLVKEETLTLEENTAVDIEAREILKGVKKYQLIKHPLMKVKVAF